jgi:hypothetical protein
MSDDTNDDLEQRVEQLEQLVEKMLPDRRQALRLGGTALAGGLLGVGATNSASAGSNQVGTIGSSGSPVDVELEDINPNSTRAVDFNNNDITGVGSIDTAGLSINPETLVRAELTSDRTGNSGNYINVKFDNEVKDTNGEYSKSTGEFVPDDSGFYLIIANLTFKSPSSSDELVANFGGGGDDFRSTKIEHTPGGKHSVVLTTVENLSANSKYIVEATNQNSNFTVNGSKNETYLAIINLFQ